MSKKVKSLLLVLCALVFAVAGVFATLAYLQDDTNEVVNTISVGDVKIDLDEAKVSMNEYGEEVVEATRVTANTYNLIPGLQYTKDPTIHVAAKSEPCYVFVKVVNPIAAAETEATYTGADDTQKQGNIAAQMAEFGWSLVPGYTDLYIHKGNVADRANIVNNKASETALDLVVFKNFKIDPALDNEAQVGPPAKIGLDSLKTNSNITIKGFAIQAYGLGDAVSGPSQDAIDAAVEALDPTVAP